VNWADLMAAQGALGTDFYDRSVLRPKHRAYYRPVIKSILGSHEMHPIHSSPSLGQSILYVGSGELYIMYYKLIYSSLNSLTQTHSYDLEKWQEQKNHTCIGIIHMYVYGDNEKAIK